MNTLNITAWHHSKITNFVGGTEVTIDINNDGFVNIARTNDGQPLVAVNTSDIKHFETPDGFSLVIELKNNQRYIFSFTRRLSAAKSILLLPFYYNWIAPLMDSKGIENRKNMISVLKIHGVTYYRQKVGQSIAIGVIIGLLLMVGFIWLLFIA